MLLTLIALSASAAPPKRVLVLDSFGRDVAPFSVAVSAFRTTLARELGQPVDIYEVPLDLARFADLGFEESLVDFLEHRFAGSPIDLVVPVGTPAVRFTAHYRHRLFEKTPVVYMGAEPRRMPPDALKTNATLVTQKVDLPGMIEDILQLQPDTTNIVAVFGVSSLDQFWAGEFRREWGAFTNRLGITWLDTLSLQQIQERVRKLPPRSFIVVPMLVLDADRVPYDGHKAFEAIHAAAGAPVFGCYASQIGRGAIGGRLYQDNRVGALAAKVAIRILRGERAEDIPPVILGHSLPTYDWRELIRWGIRPDRLPAGSVIEFREPSPWELYRWHIVGVVAFLCLQTAMIVGLLVSRARRRADQAMTTLIADLSSRFINLSADQIDSEISAAQRRVCDALGLDVSSLWQWRPDNPVMHALTHYYRPLGGPSVPQTMKGQDFFPWCQRRVLAGEIVAVSSLADFPAEAARDREVFGFYGLKTTLTIPLSVGGGPVFGSVNFNDMRRDRRWSDTLIQRLQLVAQIFANALARKVADQALHESEARLGLAADAAEIGLWSLNLATHLFWLTDKSRALFEFAPGEDITLEHFLSLVHPDDRSSVHETIQTIVQSRNEGQIQYRANWPDGRVRWMLSRGRVRCGISGEPECLMGVTMDITERKQAEASLCEREEQYRLLFEQMHSGVIVLDVILDPAGNAVDHRLVQANAEFESQTGLKRSEQLGKTSTELSFKWPDDIRQRYYQVALGGEPLHWERFNESLKRFYDVRVFSPRRGQFAVLFHDITERKQAEVEMNKLRHELARVTRLAAMGELTASLAHELNQPLTAILANAQAARRLIDSGKPDLEEIREIVADIAADDQRAGDVIRRVRGWVKKTEPVFEPLDLHELIEEVMWFVRSDALIREVSVVCDLGASVPLVLGDRIQIQQVLINSIVNAFDAMKNVSGAKQTRVRTRVLREGEVEVSVEDSGPGISPEKVEAIFEPFYTTKPDGLGMGLAICRSIIAAHGGRIWAENRPEGGAAFRFSLPARGRAKS